MTAYTLAAEHLAKHIYKRGAYKGDAPADRYIRGKTHFRVVHLPRYYESEATYRIRFHNTDILTAYPNGDVVLDAGGWVNAATTGAAFNDGMILMGMLHVSAPHRMMHRSAKHTVVHAAKGTYVYYDRMRFNHDGILLTPPRTFQETRINREESKELMAELKESGFTAMFKILHATSAVPNHRPSLPNHLRNILRDGDRANMWPDVITYYKYIGWYHNERTAAATWTAIMTDLKRGMYETKDTDVFVLPK